MSAPDDTGRFGRFGGRFVPETLMPAVLELEEAFVELADEAPKGLVTRLMERYVDFVGDAPDRDVTLLVVAPEQG